MSKTYNYELKCNQNSTGLYYFQKALADDIFFKKILKFFGNSFEFENLRKLFTFAVLKKT